jgi:DNA-binding CsgD family transcriptional regulator
MEQADRLIRGLYALAIDEDWAHYRAVGLERVCRDIGAAAGAWLTHDADPMHAGEFTLWPADLPVAALVLQKLPLRERAEHALDGPMPAPGLKRGVALQYAHQDSRLVSRIVFWFGSKADAPAGEELRRTVGHMVEAGALALKHFILSDERLSRWGRSNRGTAAMIDRRGIVYAASKGFQELLATEFGPRQFDQMPFTLPGDLSGENGSFSHGALRFRAVKTDEVHYLIYARKAQPLDGLSPREQQIARSLAAGKTFKSVARQCGIAVSTVANHASRIYRKLGIYRREELFELMRASGGARGREQPQSEA